MSKIVQSVLALSSTRASAESRRSVNCKGTSVGALVQPTAKHVEIYVFFTCFFMDVYGLDMLE